MRMLIIKRLLIIPFLLLFIPSFGQLQYGIGYTVAWLCSNTNVAGGFSFFIGKNIVETSTSSFSISTNLKIGMADRIGTGVLGPILLVALYFDAKSGDNNISNSLSNINTDGIDGGKIHLFADIPVLVHYNFGLGSSSKCNRKFGFYLGGGFSYTTTGYTDSLEFSKGTGFFGYVMDGGVRFAKNVDINLSNTISLRQPIYTINHPVFTEITLSLRLDYGRRTRFWICLNCFYFL